MILRSIGGFFLFVGIVWLLSENRRRFPVRTVAAGLGLQVFLAVALLKFPYCARIFAWLNRAAWLWSSKTLNAAAGNLSKTASGPMKLKSSMQGPGQISRSGSMALPVVMLRGFCYIVFFSSIPETIQKSRRSG
jgi:CNT family concentrative nucleoside transporter